MWLAGGLAAAAGWPVWTRWLAAALVWPIAPLALLILVSARLGMRRVGVTLTLLGAVACALGWRAGLVAAVTVHAQWMLPPADEPTPTITPTPTPTPVEPPTPVPSPVDATRPAPRPVDVPSPPVERDVGEPRPAGARSRCFREVVTTAHSDHAYGTTLVDLDGDAVLDVVAIDSLFSHAIRVWKGDRTGRFRPASTLEYDGGGLDFAVLDVDRDGKLDLATADHERASVTVWTGAGDGSFTRGASHKTYRSPLGIWAADLDVDGFSDLVVAHYFHVEVLRGGKGGQLRTTPWLRLEKEPADPSTLLTPEDIVAVDLTGDRALDLVIPKGDVTSIEVWTGRGRAGFRRAAAVPSCSAPSHTLVGDVVEDGRVDVAVRCGDARFELFAGDGAGGLASRGRFGPDDFSEAGALVDLTGDGHLDLIASTLPGGLADVAAFDRHGVLVVYAGDGKGEFRERDTLALTGVRHRIVAVVDIDGDERLDVVHECFGQSPGGHLGVVFGAGC